MADALTPVAFTDVQYEGAGATAACVVAARFQDADPIEEHVVGIASVSPYRPGAFYERELPCLLSVLARVTVQLRAIVVDGYVDLDEVGSPGLGAHLYARLDAKIPVIGVAKTSYRGAGWATPVLRGTSRVPLFVTARGIEVADAARLVREMHGPHRLPTLLTRVDQLARGLLQPG